MLKVTNSDKNDVNALAQFKVFDNKSYIKYLSSELYFCYLESRWAGGEKAAREENKVEKRIIMIVSDQAEQRE